MAAFRFCDLGFPAAGVVVGVHLMGAGRSAGHENAKGRPRSGRPLPALRAKSALVLGDYGLPRLYPLKLERSSP